MHRMSARHLSWFGFLPLALSACTCLTEPGAGAPAQQEQPQAAAAPAPAPTPPPPAPAPTAPPSAAANEQIGALHILIAYKGSMRAAATITRSKEDAQKLASSVLLQAKKPGADFGALAVQYSDDPSAKQGKGSLGKFSRGQMVKPFSDAAFALNPGGISAIVETPFGFHVIKRTE